LEPGDRARFEAIVLPHLDAACGLARCLMRNAADAEDVVQEAFLRALRHFDGFRGATASDGRAWVLTIVRNAAHTWQSRRGARGMTEFDETVHSVPVEPEALTTAARQDARETVSGALERLPQDLREVIVLREIEGLSYKEIGDVAGVPIGTVMSRLSRARRRLHDALVASGETR